MATLRVYRGDQFVAPFELGEGRTRIGRGTENQLVLEDKDKQVSRSHAEIWFERGHYVIADLNSQNGVWIGERQIKTEEVLPVNVPVTIGPYRLILEASAPTLLADTGEMTSQQVAFVEQTQLANSASIPPSPQPAGRSHVTKIPAARVASQLNSKLVPLLALGALGAAAVIALVIFIANRRTDEGTSAGNTGTPPATTSTTTVPPDKSPEELFQEHFARAQTELEAGNPTAAKEANAAALVVLPGDPRGLAQQQGIDGILNPPPPDPLAGRKPTSDTAALDPERDRAQQAARGQVDQGRRALEAGRFQDAIALLEAAGRSGADLGIPPSELDELLGKAKSGRSAEVLRERQANAQKLLDEARSSAASDALIAFQRFRDARSANPELPGLAEVQAIVEREARRQGEAALTLAKNRDNGGRTEEAIKYYERALPLLEILQGGHDGIAVSRLRLQQLKGK